MKKNNFMKIFKFKALLLATIFLSSISLPVLAADGTLVGDLRLTTSPLPIDLKVTPNSSSTAQVKVKNDGSSTENIKVSLMKFKADPVTGAPLLSERENGDEYFNWVTFSESNFSLPSNEWKTITATFNVPSTASFDYYYAIVFSRAQDMAPTGERQTLINGGTATLVLLEVVVPNAKKEVQLTNFSVNKNIFEFLPATFTAKLKNTGNVHVAPRGNIFISKGNEKDIAILEVNDAQGSILPNSPRTFESQWLDGFPVYTIKQVDGKAVLDDKGNLSWELKWNFANASKLRWGKYTAKIVMVYNDGQRDVPVEDEVSFWVMPWRILGGGLIISIFVLIGLKSTFQNIWKKASGFFRKS